MNKFGQSIVIGFIGIITIWASLTEQKWFFNNPKAELFVKLFGLKGAKIFYTVIGVFCLIVALIIGYLSY